MRIALDPEEGDFLPCPEDPGSGGPTTLEDCEYLELIGFEVECVLEEEQILICPDSFSFHLKGSNWRAAGLKDFNFTIMDLQKNKVNTIIFSYEVGFPINTADGRYFSEAFVRNIAEIAHNQAEAYIGVNYTLDFFEPGAQVKYGNKFVRKMEEIIRKKLNHNGAIVNFGLITISDNEAKQPVYKGIFGCD